MFDTDESLDDSYFKDENLYPWHVFHFGKCLERQCELEIQHKQPFPKRMPLPMCKIGQRHSINIDKKGLYWILREMKKRYLALGRFPPNLSEARFNNLVSQQQQFTHDMYHDWITRLFRIQDVIRGGKHFSKTGIGVTTDGVQISVHFTKVIDNNPGAKKKPIRSVRAHVNSKRHARVTRLVQQNIKRKEPTIAILASKLVYDFHFVSVPCEF